jgi:16S rRNA (guanine527-N7)-methyltransferase
MNEFIDLFLIWNAKINLSAARTRKAVIEHIDDSRHVVPLLTGQVLDVGSGGGFPVVVAAVERPEIQLVALEPNHKKHAFLREATRVLNLSNLEVRCERLEVHTRRNYDTVMSRATFDLVVWLATGLSYVNASGRVLGFEAVHRRDLPTTIVRHAYTIDGKPRAIVELRAGE